MARRKVGHYFSQAFLATIVRQSACLSPVPLAGNSPYTHLSLQSGLTQPTAHSRKPMREEVVRELVTRLMTELAYLSSFHTDTVRGAIIRGYALPQDELA